MWISERILPATQPFDFQQTLKFLGLFPPMAGEQQVSGQALTKALRIDGKTIAFRVQSESDRAAHCTLLSDDSLDEQIQNATYDRIAFFLSLNDDMTSFYALADQTFQPIIDLLYGYHQVKFLSPFEAACWAVLTARNRMPVARFMKQRIMDFCGCSVSVDGVKYLAFPEPADVLSADPSQLIQIIGTSMRRSEYFFSVVQAFATADEEWLRTGDYDEVRKWLRQIKGIGEWASSFILIRALGRMERLIVPEKNLIEAASKLYGRPLTADDVIELAQQYGNYQAYWAHYIRAAS
jgi:DNA-3-methyladenine glycosylase II